jgi:hypothetical protein
LSSIPDFESGAEADVKARFVAAAWLALVGANAGAQVFDLSTSTLHLPQVTVGSTVYDVVLRYDADGRLSLTQVTPSLPSIVGSWYFEQAGAPGAPKLRVTFTFLADGTYMMADDGNTTAADPSGQPGIEVGTYTYNAATGAFSSTCPYINTDGQWGLSHGNQFGLSGCVGSAATATIQGNVMVMSFQNAPDGNPQATLTRLTP